jgi:hypothetical protein
MFSGVDQLKIHGRSDFGRNCNRWLTKSTELFAQPKICRVITLAATGLPPDCNVLSLL